MQFGFREMMFTSLLLGMVAGTYAVIVRPHARQRQQRLADMHSMDAAVSEARDCTEGLEDLAQHIHQQEQATAFFRSRLPKEADIEKAINEVIQTAAANSLQAGEIQMLKREQSDGVSGQPVHMQFSGDFNGFYSFLLQLEEMPRVMRITQLDVAGGDHSGQIRAELALMMYFDSGATTPEPIDSPSAITPREVVTNYLNGGKENRAELLGMLSSTDKLMQRCLADPDGAQISLSKLRSDPLGVAPVVQSAASNAAQAHETDGARVAMLQQIEKLQVQSIVSSGERPACMIDNRLYREGEQIDDFTIERIDQSEVVVRNGDYRFELRITGS